MTILRVLLCLFTSPSLAADEPTVEELLTATDDIQRGASSRAVISMHVKTKRYERTMKMNVLSKGTDRSLVTILEPAKDAGISTLMVGDNLWNYLPKVDRIMKIPTGMMGGSWMGSHFSNDDLVKDSRLSEDFTATITQRPSKESPDTPYSIELIPRPDAAIVWGKVIVQISADQVPIKIQYLDEKGKLARVMSFDDVREVGTRKVPMKMRLTPTNKDGEYTEITYEELNFDVPVDEKMFTLQALKR